MVHILLKPGLENFEHYFASVWDECNCAIVWTFFGIAFLWGWNENWPFPICGHCWVLKICWHTECSTFTASSFRIWNSSPGIPSPPLALFIVMLPMAHLTLLSRKSGNTISNSCISPLHKEVDLLSVFWNLDEPCGCFTMSGSGPDNASLRSKPISSLWPVP